MTTVYRVQDNEGRGPFRPGFSHLWVEARADHDNLHPWTIDFAHAMSVIQRARGNLGCGCESIEQLQRWFTPSEYATLRTLGYRAISMSVNRVIQRGKTQCVFERRKPLRFDVQEIELYPGDQQ